MKRKLLSILHNGQSKKYGISILFLIFLTANTALGATYYIDSVAGLDSNNGTAIATPWKSVSKVNSKTLVAGDKIYLKCGSVWNGQQLKFSGSGSAASPIIVDQYGTGAKPILNGNGLTTADQGVVYLYNQQYIEINNLEITNYPTLLVYANNTAYTLNQIVYNGIYAYIVTVAGTTPASGGTPIHSSGTAVSGTVTFSYYCKLTNLSYPDNMFFTGISDGVLNNNPLGADRRGVMIALKDKGTGAAAVANHIYLKNLYIHHIKGQLGNGSTTVNGAIPKRTGGIYFTVLNETTGNNSRFNDVLIDGCSISYSENVGLAFDNEDNVYYPGGTELALWTARKFTNIKVSNNTIHHIGKNAMIIRCTDETGLIEHNTCYETALGTTGNTMFSARAKGTVFQYNEGYYNRATTQTVDPGTIDGSMYDPDYGSVGIIFQYSYSHDNSEGIYWGCNTRSLSNNTSGIPDPEDVGCTLRYNISQNDKGDLIFLNYSSAGNEIYNNIFYIKSGLSPNIIHENSGNNHTYNFYNNIIYNLGNGGYAFGSGTGIQTRTIQNNTFYGSHPSDEPLDINKLTSNPLFVNPGAGTTGINSLLEGYKLQNGSPAISSGKVVASNGGFDFFGNVVSSSAVPNRGIYQGEAIVSITPAPTASAQNFCALNPTVANLVATGTLLKWYANEIGGTALATSTILVTATYYVSQTISGVESSRTAVAVSVNITNSPLAIAQVFCNSATVADLVATGTNLQWYIAATGGSALATSAILTSRTYYVSQTLNSCESARTSVLVTVNATSAPSASTQVFCNSGTVTDLVATGTDLHWYVALTGGSSLATTNSLTSGTYYVSQTLNSCESLRTSVFVTVNTTLPPSANAQVFCNSGTVANLAAIGTNLQWYSASVSGSVLATTTALVSGTYYVSQTLNGCVSDRTSVAVTRNSTTAPVAIPQSFCVLSSPTVATLAATGESLKWYTVLTGGTELETTTALASGTYYVSQTLNGCESTRHSVVVTITSGYSYFVDADGDGYGSTTAVQFCDATVPQGYSANNTDCDDNFIASALELANGIDDNCNGLIDEGLIPQAPIVNSPLNLCKGQASVQLTATPILGYTLKWYTTETITTPLSDAPIVTSVATKTYWVSQKLGSNGLESTRVPITVKVNALPATVATLTTSEVVLCKYIGTTNEVTYTASSGSSSYVWSVPTGVSIISGQETATLVVNFNSPSLSGVVGSLGLIGVKAMDINGCISSKAKTIALTTKVPVAPATLVLSNSEILGGAPIQKIGPYIGTTMEFTLTAAAANSAEHYRWLLPEGMNVTSNNVTTTLGIVTSTSPTITVNFADVAPGIGSFLIRVYSVGGCSESTARILTLARALPTAPAALVLTAIANNAITFPIATVDKITKVGPYVGKLTELTLAATGITAQGATATSYEWVLPAGVTSYGTTSTTVGEVTTISSTSSIITVDFAGVNPGVLSLPISVYAVNGVGKSLIRTLTLTSAPPATPVITYSSPTTTFDTCHTTMYTATSIPGATYNWTIPVGATGTSTTNSIVVDFSNVTVASAYFIKCTAANGTGISAVKSLTIKKAATCANPRIAPEVSTADVFKVIAYPNPSSSVFTLDFKSSIKGKSTGIQVYDMAGRLIEKRQANSNSVEIGAKYASGIYNVIVNQGTKVTTLKVIKQ